MIYFVFAVLATIFAYCAVHGRISVKTSIGRKYQSRSVYHIFMLLSFLCYFIPSAVRYGIGQDYFYTYYPMFNFIRNGTVSIYTNSVIKYNEVGFTLINKIIGKFTDNPQWVFVITSAFCLVLAYKCIMDYSPNITFSVFMLVLGSYYMGSYSLIRQSMVIVIFLYSLRFIENRRIIPYMLCCAIAISIQTISIIFIPFYFIGSLKLTKKQYFVASLSVIVGANICRGIVLRIVQMTRFANRINLSSDYNILLSMVVCAVFVVSVLGLKNDEDERYRLYTNILFICTCLIGISGYLDTSDRIIYAYYYTNFITIPYIFKYSAFKQSDKRLIKICVISALFILWGYEHLYYDQFSVLPYVSIFG